MVDTSSSNQTRRHVYNCERVIEVRDHKISALDSYDNVAVLGNQKGYVAPYEQRFDARAPLKVRLIHCYPL